MSFAPSFTAVGANKKFKFNIGSSHEANAAKARSRSRRRQFVSLISHNNMSRLIGRRFSKRTRKKCEAYSATTRNIIGPGGRVVVRNKERCNVAQTRTVHLPHRPLSHLRPKLFFGGESVQCSEYRRKREENETRKKECAGTF